jgi:hypothetical protein
VPAFRSIQRSAELTDCKSLGFLKEAAARRGCPFTGSSGQQMKISHPIQSIFHLLKIGIGVTALAALSACASSSLIKQTDSKLPIQTVHSGSGTIMSSRAYLTHDRLFVVGRAKPHQLVQPKHVDIELIGANNRVISEKTEELDAPGHPRISSSRHGHQVYVASFALSEAREAVKIRVVYHFGSHREASS